MKNFPIQVKVFDFQLAQLEVSQATSIEQGKDKPVSQKFWGFKQNPHFVCTKHNGKFFGPFDTGKDYPAFGLLIDSIEVPEAIDSMLEVAVRWGLVILFKVMEIVKNCFIVKVQQVMFEV